MSYAVTALIAYRVLDTFNEALIIHALYYYAVLNYVNPKALLKPVWCVETNYFEISL